jgi:hypothetical protein
VLGASAVMTTAGRDGGVEGVASAASSLLSGLGLGPEQRVAAEAPDTVETARESDTSSINVDFTAKSTNQEFARVYREINSLKGEVLALRETNTVTAVGARVDDLNDKVDVVRANMSLLQSSLDDLSSGRDGETDQINKRLAKIEDVISIRGDVTASIPHQTFPPLPRRRALRGAGWIAEATANGTYTVRGPTGTYEVTIGSYVPGLGRIEAIRNQGGRLRLVTGKDHALPAAAE